VSDSSKLRGKDAFHIEDHDSYLEIVAELVRGAQLGRKDKLMFARKVALHKSASVHYKAQLKVIRSRIKGREFCGAMMSSTLNAKLENAEVTVTGGVLRVRVPVTEAERMRWVRARTGATYTVVDFLLPADLRFGNSGCSDFSASLSVVRWEADGARKLPIWVLG
jgi:hypothetical protein